MINPSRLLLTSTLPTITCITMPITKPIIGTPIEKIPISLSILTLSIWNGVLPSDFLMIRYMFLNIMDIKMRMIIAPIPKRINAVISGMPPRTGTATSNPYTESSVMPPEISKPAKYPRYCGATAAQITAAVMIPEATQ